MPSVFLFKISKVTCHNNYWNKWCNIFCKLMEVIILNMHNIWFQTLNMFDMLLRIPFIENVDFMSKIFQSIGIIPYQRFDSSPSMRRYRHNTRSHNNYL